VGSGLRIRSASVVLAAGAASLVAFTGAAVAAAPHATTGPATAVGATSATVTGTVDPGGQSTSWYVEYGTSTSYGSKTSSTSAGSGSSAVSVSASLSGLKPGTTYHYRVVASNGTGTNRGGDAVFTTLVPPDAVTGSASAVSASGATLNGTVDPNGRSTSYYFEYGTSTSYGTKTATKDAGSATTAQAVSAGIGGLQAGHTYHFRIVASSDAGTSTGKDETFTASSAPSVATGDAASITPTSATLKGTVTPNGLTTTWWFEYGTSTAYGSKTSSVSAGSGRSAKSVSAAVKKLKAATTYHYRLVAQNSAGRVAGDDRTFSTVGPPAAVTAAAQNVGADTAVLAGSLDTHGRATSWWFQYGTSTHYGRSTSAKSTPSKAGTRTVTATLTGLAPAATYHYRLVAKSDAGTTYGADVSFTTAGVTLAVVGRQVVFGGRVRLTGIVPTGQAGEQVVVYAQPYGGGSFRSIATVLTGAGGAWALLVRPQVGTAYEASWRGGTSAPVTIGVHPRVTLTLTSSGHFVARALGGRSFAHRIVQIQRRVGTRWHTIKRVRLGPRSRAEFHLTLPRGQSILRAAFSVNQAGVGFLGGTSRPLKIRRTQ
jgi:phosphodiesterase/alkaline phosphatase D-like protein